MRFNVVLFMLIVALLGGLSTCSSEVPIGFDTDELSFDMSLVLLTGDMRQKHRILITHMPQRRSLRFRIVMWLFR